MTPLLLSLVLLMFYVRSKRITLFTAMLFLDLPQFAPSVLSLTGWHGCVGVMEMALDVTLSSVTRNRSRWGDALKPLLWMCQTPNKSPRNIPLCFCLWWRNTIAMTCLCEMRHSLMLTKRKKAKRKNNHPHWCYSFLKRIVCGEIAKSKWSMGKEKKNVS